MTTNLVVADASRTEKTICFAVFPSLKTTGITATAGIGTNMYLSKITMDIVAKKMPPDKDGVRIAKLDEISYRRLLWEHKPLTSFWRVGKGIANKLEKYGMYTMGDVARMSLSQSGEDLICPICNVRHLRDIAMP